MAFDKGKAQTPIAQILSHFETSFSLSLSLYICLYRSNATIILLCVTLNFYSHAPRISNSFPPKEKRTNLNNHIVQPIIPIEKKERKKGKNKNSKKKKIANPRHAYIIYIYISIND